MAGTVYGDAQDRLTLTLAEAPWDLFPRAKEQKLKVMTTSPSHGTVFNTTE